ncbi:hypothetical protein IFM89_009487 [Coptis chinensis]|uniref:Asparagine--tRNA ligase n=1 Tax=Coptis chinensis TaxID=261450 RepID=A0A835I3C9_9MAGN|nr:hypothetical protein IFM89_009487 [Coptis chinensis]
MKKKKKKLKVMEDVNDNLDGNVNVEDVLIDGGGPSIEGLALMVDGNETDYASSDDHDSPEVSNEEDEMRPRLAARNRNKFLIFNTKTEIKKIQFEVGMRFGHRNELKGALKDYVVATGCPVKWSINKASRMLANSQWLAKSYHDRIISNPVARIRNALAYATHTFFQMHNLYVHTPIITTSDCEGAGEMFQVTTLFSDADKVDKELKQKPPPSEADIEAAKKLVSEKGEAVKSAKAKKEDITDLVETFACALSNVYTFGPTFRAEHSHTSRHLAEFWMVEPEIAFADLELLLSWLQKKVLTAIPKGCPVSKGILQPDMWGVVPSDRWDWSALKSLINKNGGRNSLLVAPMSTASTSQILGNNECFEPYTSNIYSRRVLSGEFVVVNKDLHDLVEMGLWSPALKNKIIYENGSVLTVVEIPDDLKAIYRYNWEVHIIL